jgi:hypothetical protein
MRPSMGVAARKRQNRQKLFAKDRVASFHTAWTYSVEKLDFYSV